MSATAPTPQPARRTEKSVDDARIRSGVKLLVALVALMWLSEAVDTALHGQLDQYGIVARTPDGLLGILTAPFLHLGFGHLISNTLPLVTLGLLIAVGGAVRLFSVKKPIVAAVQGAAVGAGLGLAVVADFRVAAHELAQRGVLAGVPQNPEFPVATALLRRVHAARAYRRFAAVRADRSVRNPELYAV